MKKIIVAIFVLLFGLFFAPNNFVVSADILDKNPNVQTIYTDDVLDFKNLNDISLLAVNEKYIAYSNSNTEVTLFNKTTKTYTKNETFENIFSINFVENKLLVAEKNGIQVLDTDNFSTHKSLEGTNFSSNLKAVDVYVDNTIIYIGYIDNGSFTLNEYTLDLDPKQNPIKELSDSSLQNATALAINDKSAYIVSKPSDTTTLYKLNYQSNNLEKVVEKTLTELDTFYFDNQEYLIACTAESLCLYGGTKNQLTTIDIDQKLTISNFDYFNNKIYLADQRNDGTIQEYYIEIGTDGNSPTYNLKPSRILICSKSKDIGRFNNASGILVSGTNIIVADKGNNSIHLIDTLSSKTEYINQIEVENSIKHFTAPSNPTLDEDLNLYFVSKNDSNSAIIKYGLDTETSSVSSLKYNYAKTYDTINSVNIGSISSISSYKNVVYAIDYTNDKLLSITSNGIQEKTELSFDANEKSKIICLKSSNTMAVYNNQTLYLLDSTGSVKNRLVTDEELTSITCDYNHIYGLGSNKIHIFSIVNSTEHSQVLTELEGIESTKLANINCISFDIASRVMYGFDCIRECLVKFDFTEIANPFEGLSDISDTTPLTTSPLSLTLKQTKVGLDSSKITPVIYAYPNQIGTAYNLDGSITNCIGIEDYDNEYRVLFEHNNTLAVGFVSKQNVQQKESETAQTNVITINKKVPIYKYPTLLKYNGSIIKIGELEHKTVFNVSGKYAVSIDGKLFYKYEFDGKIGYIFNADIVENSNKIISTVPSTNATIKAIGADKITILKSINDEENEEILELKNGDRVYIESYSKDSKYTKIIYTDKNQKTIEGYVLTEYVEMDKLDETKIILIIVIIVSLILLGVIVASYIVIRKKRK